MVVHSSVALRRHPTASTITLILRAVPSRADGRRLMVTITTSRETEERMPALLLASAAPDTPSMQEEDVQTGKAVVNLI